MRSLSVKTSTLAGTAVLGALTVVFDYVMKFSGFKIIFPWLPFLPKFDFTGIPIVLSYLLYGLTSGGTTSIIALLAILARSGNFVSSSMKGISEFSTVFGMAVGLRYGRTRKATSLTLGIASRCVIMCIVNMIVLPYFYGMPLEVVIPLLPLIVVFNAMHGALSILGGYVIHEALIHRAPSLVKPP